MNDGIDETADATDSPVALEPDAGAQQESPTTQAEPRRRNRGGRKAAGRVEASGEDLTGSVPAKTSEAVRPDEPTAPAEAGSASEPVNKPAARPRRPRKPATTSGDI